MSRFDNFSSNSSQSFPNWLPRPFWPFHAFLQNPRNSRISSHESFMSHVSLFHQVTGEAGYVAYKTCTPIFDQLLRDKFDSKHSELRIIDAGAGTGIVGKVLQDLGYTNIDALDISQKMLDEAKKLNVYKNFFCAPLSEEPVAEIANDQYDALICIGTLTVGHVKPSAFDEILRIVKSGKELRVCLYKVSQPYWQGWPAFDTV